MNRTKTLILLTTLTALLLWAGQALAGQAGLTIALAVALVLNFGSYWFSDEVVLRMYGAQEVDENDAARLYAIVRELAVRGNIPTPRVYLIPEDAPNAFATGRNPQHAAMAVTERDCCARWIGWNSQESSRTNSPTLRIGTPSS
jgi:heat shock protein HtpX